MGYSLWSSCSGDQPPFEGPRSGVLSQNHQLEIGHSILQFTLLDPNQAPKHITLFTLLMK